MRVSRIAALAVAVAVAAAGLAGCSATDSGPDARITANGAEPERPLLTTDTVDLAGARILDSLYAGLVFYDEDGSVQNDAAESITPNDDNSAFTVTIRDGLTFSDGEPLTSASFVDAWNFGAQPSNAQAGRWAYSPILGFDPTGAVDVDLVASGGLTILDATRFIVTLSAPSVDFVLRLGIPAFYPLPAAALADPESFGQRPIGNGPYALDGDGAWQRDEQLDLVANAAYDGPRQALNGAVSLIFYRSEADAYADLLSGNLDVLDRIPEAARASFGDVLGDAALDLPSSTVQTLTIPAGMEHFSGPEGELRRAAISRAIDRQKLGEAAVGGSVVSAVDFGSPAIDGYPDDQTTPEALQFDDDAAIDLWAQADAIAPWDGSLTITHDTRDGAWAAQLAAQLADVLGIDVSNAAVSADDLATRLQAGAVDSAFLTTRTGRYPSLVDYLGPVFGTGGEANVSGYSDPEFDAVLAEANAATDVDAANDILQTAQLILLDDLPQIPLWYEAIAGGFRDDLAGVTVDWRGVPRYYQIEKAGAQARSD